jgi:membrane associated rhomboid family serine protease
MPLSENLDLPPAVSRESAPLGARLMWLLAPAAVFWIVEIVNALLGHQLCVWGIIPRTKQGLPGILFSPFLHAGFGHLISNTLPYLALGSLVVARGVGQFLAASVFIILVGGLGVWTIGSPGLHVGASGLIFGYFGFLVALGWYERSLSSLLVSVMVIILYGGMIWGILPMYPGVSWEAHFCGLIAGILAAPVFAFQSSSRASDR